MTESGSLPYTLLLFLLELGVGGTLVMHAVHLRGQATPGFVRATTIMAPILLGLAFWTAYTLDGDVVQGFTIGAAAREAMVWLLAAATVLSIAHNAALYSARDSLAREIGWALSAVCVGVVAAAGAMLSGASTALIIASLALGALAMGLAAVGLALGHWYLVTPRLPARPLVEIATVFLVIIGLQALVFGIALVVSVETPQGGRDLALSADPTFWLRIVIGFALPLVFGWMAWSTARMRSMMAATGLLYLTTAAVLAGQIAARALLFDSGRAL